MTTKFESPSVYFNVEKLVVNPVFNLNLDDYTYTSLPVLARILRDNSISLGWIVTRLAWIASKLASSMRATIKASVLCCKASKAAAANRKSV